MNRRANLLYLQNLRDLEVAREKLKHYHSDYWYKNASKVQLIRKQTVFQCEEPYEEEVPLSVYKEPFKPSFDFSLDVLSVLGFILSCSLMILFLVVVIHFGVLLNEKPGSFTSGDHFMLGIFCLFAFCFSIYPIIKIGSFIKEVCEFINDISKYKKEKIRLKIEVDEKNQQIRHQNADIQLRNAQKGKNNAIIRQNNQKLKDQAEAKIENLIEQRVRHTQWYNIELEKLDVLIADLYNMNVLPDSPYHTWRGLAPVCYIYNVLSTSTEFSLRDVLFSQQFESGVQRLEAKMDVMIGQLGSLVYETRCIKQNTDILIRQNEEMLEEESKNMQTLIEQNKKQVNSVQELEESMKRNEQYTLEAAQYASLSANYAKANAYFSLAEYLKQ